jgi:hypothetical protein
VVKTVEIPQNLVGQSQRRVRFTRLPVYSFRAHGAQSSIQPQYWRKSRSFQATALTTPSAQQEEAEEVVDAEEDDQEEKEEEETSGLGEGAAANNVVYEVRRRLRPRQGVVHTDEHLSRFEEEGEIVRAIEKAPGSQQKQYNGPWVVIPRREKQ